MNNHQFDFKPITIVPSILSSRFNFLPSEHLNFIPDTPLTHDPFQFNPIPPQSSYQSIQFHNTSSLPSSSLSSSQNGIFIPTSPIISAPRNSNPSQFTFIIEPSVPLTSSPSSSTTKSANFPALNHMTIFSPSGFHLSEFTPLQNRSLPIGNNPAQTQTQPITPIFTSPPLPFHSSSVYETNQMKLDIKSTSLFTVDEDEEKDDKSILYPYITNRSHSIMPFLQTQLLKPEHSLITIEVDQDDNKNMTTDDNFIIFSESVIIASNITTPYSPTVLSSPDIINNDMIQCIDAHSSTNPLPLPLILGTTPSVTLINTLDNYVNRNPSLCDSQNTSVNAFHPLSDPQFPLYPSIFRNLPNQRPSYLHHHQSTSKSAKRNISRRYPPNTQLQGPITRNNHPHTIQQYDSDSSPPSHPIDAMYNNIPSNDSSNNDLEENSFFSVNKLNYLSNIQNVNQPISLPKKRYKTRKSSYNDETNTTITAYSSKLHKKNYNRKTSPANLDADVNKWNEINFFRRQQHQNQQIFDSTSLYTQSNNSLDLPFPNRLSTRPISSNDNTTQLSNAVTTTTQLLSNSPPTRNLFATFSRGFTQFLIPEEKTNQINTKTVFFVDLSRIPPALTIFQIFSVQYGYHKLLKSHPLFHQFYKLLYPDKIPSLNDNSIFQTTSQALSLDVSSSYHNLSSISSHESTRTTLTNQHNPKYPESISIVVNYSNYSLINPSGSKEEQLIDILIRDSTIAEQRSIEQKAKTLYVPSQPAQTTYIPSTLLTPVPNYNVNSRVSQLLAINVTPPRHTDEFPPKIGLPLIFKSSPNLNTMHDNLTPSTSQHCNVPSISTNFLNNNQNYPRNTAYTSTLFVPSKNLGLFFQQPDQNISMNSNHSCHSAPDNHNNSLSTSPYTFTRKRLIKRISTIQFDKFVKKQRVYNRIQRRRLEIDAKKSNQIENLRQEQPSTHHDSTLLSDIDTNQAVHTVTATKRIKKKKLLTGSSKKNSFYEPTQLDAILFSFAYFQHQSETDTNLDFGEEFDNDEDDNDSLSDKLSD